MRSRLCLSSVLPVSSLAQIDDDDDRSGGDDPVLTALVQRLSERSAAGADGGVSAAQTG